MKKLFLLFLPLFLFVSCSNEDDLDVEPENIGSVVGTWAFTSCSASVETSSSNVLVSNLLQVALQSYASSQEPSYYVFDQSGNFSAYVTENEEAILSASGTYALTDNALVLTYSDSEGNTNSSTETFDIIIANESTLKMRKDYSNSLAYWGAGILGEYVGISLSKATVTVTYSVQ